MIFDVSGDIAFIFRVRDTSIPVYGSEGFNLLYGLCVMSLVLSIAGNTVMSLYVVGRKVRAIPHS